MNAATALVTYASKRGSTREVADAAAATLRKDGIHVDVRPAGDVSDVAKYDAVVLGAALYMGRLHGDARASSSSGIATHSRSVPSPSSPWARSRCPTRT
jgi:flavorubredoxin